MQFYVFCVIPSSTMSSILHSTDDWLDWLLDSSDNVNYMYNTHSLLALAAYHDNPRTVTRLLSQPGIIVNRQVENGEKDSPLSASVARSMAATRLLLQHPDIDVNETNEDDSTAFHNACDRREGDTLELLLKTRSKTGLITNVVDCNGNTASHWACRHGNLHAVQVLTKYGCFDVTSRNADGLFSIDFAIRFGQGTIVQYFLVTLHRNKENMRVKIHKDCDIGHVLLQSIKDNQTQLVQMLLNHLDVSLSNVKVAFECLQILIERPCQKSFLYVMKYVYPFALLSFIRINRLFRKAVNDSLEPAIVKACFVLWENSTKLYSALCLVYAVVVLRHPLTAKRAAETFMQKIQLNYLLLCVYGSFNQSPFRVVNLLYFAAKYGLLSAIKLVFDICPILNIKRLTDVIEGKNICILNLAMRYPNIDCFLIDVMKINNAKIDNCEIELFRLWYKLLSKISSTLNNEQQPQTSNDRNICARFQEMEELLIDLNLSGHQQERQNVHDAIQAFMRDLADEVGSLDPLLFFKPVLVGSAKEGTRPYLPNEFDFLVVFVEIAKYVDIYYNALFSQRNSVKVKQRNLINALQNSPYNSDGFLAMKLLKSDFEDVIRKGIKNLFQKKKNSYYSQMHVESAFLQIKPISCLRLIWRGREFKDMPIYIGLVMSLPLNTYNPIIDVFREPTISYKNKCKYFLFWKSMSYHDIQLYIAFSDVEQRLISELPKSARKGFIIAKAMRLRELAPHHVSSKLQNVDTLDECLKTYSLITSLFFCVLFVKRTSCLQAPHVPLQWTYLIFKHLQTRLKIGTVLIPFEWCGDPQARLLLYCKCPIDLTSEQWNGCLSGAMIFWW